MATPAQATLDLSSITGNSTYDPSNQDVKFDIYYLGSSGSWQYAQQVTEYVGGNLDPVLAKTVLDDSSGNPIANTDVAIRIEPIGGTAGTASYPQVGTGVTDTNGYIDAGANLTSYLQNSQYDSGDSVTVDVYTQDSSGNQTFVQAVPYTSGTYDPVLEKKQVLNSSGQPVAGANVRVMADHYDSTERHGPDPARYRNYGRIRPPVCHHRHDAHTE